MGLASPPGSPPRRARLAVIVVFMLHGFIFASWTIRIPDVKAQLNLSDGALGLALLGPPIGAITANSLSVGCSGSTAARGSRWR